MRTLILMLPENTQLHRKGCKNFVETSTRGPKPPLRLGMFGPAASITQGRRLPRTR